MSQSQFTRCANDVDVENPTYYVSNRRPIAKCSHRLLSTIPIKLLLMFDRVWLKHKNRNIDIDLFWFNSMENNLPEINAKPVELGAKKISLTVAIILLRSNCCWMRCPNGVPTFVEQILICIECVHCTQLICKQTFTFHSKMFDLFVFWQDFYYLTRNERLGNMTTAVGH